MLRSYLASVVHICTSLLSLTNLLGYATLKWTSMILVNLNFIKERKLLKIKNFTSLVILHLMRNSARVINNIMKKDLLNLAAFLLLADFKTILILHFFELINLYLFHNYLNCFAFIFIIHYISFLPLCACLFLATLFLYDRFFLILSIIQDNFNTLFLNV